MLSLPDSAYAMSSNGFNNNSSNTSNQTQQPFNQQADTTAGANEQDSDAESETDSLFDEFTDYDGYDPDQQNNLTASSNVTNGSRDSTQYQAPGLPSSSSGYQHPPSGPLPAQTYSLGGRGTGQGSANFGLEPVNGGEVDRAEKQSAQATEGSGESGDKEDGDMGDFASYFPKDVRDGAEQRVNQDAQNQPSRPQYITDPSTEEAMHAFLDVLNAEKRGGLDRELETGFNEAWQGQSHSKNQGLAVAPTAVIPAANQSYGMGVSHAASTQPQLPEDPFGPQATKVTPNAPQMFFPPDIQQPNISFGTTTAAAGRPRVRQQRPDTRSEGAVRETQAHPISHQRHQQRQTGAGELLHASTRSRGSFATRGSAYRGDSYMLDDDSEEDQVSNGQAGAPDRVSQASSPSIRTAETVRRRHTTIMNKAARDARRQTMSNFDGSLPSEEGGRHPSKFPAPQLSNAAFQPLPSGISATHNQPSVSAQTPRKGGRSSQDLRTQGMSSYTAAATRPNVSGYPATPANEIVNLITPPKRQGRTDSGTTLFDHSRSIGSTGQGIQAADPLDSNESTPRSSPTTRGKKRKASASVDQPTSKRVALIEDMVQISDRNVDQKLAAFGSMLDLNLSHETETSIRNAAQQFATRDQAEDFMNGNSDLNVFYSLGIPANREDVHRVVGKVRDDIQQTMLAALREPPVPVPSDHQLGEQYDRDQQKSYAQIQSRTQQNFNEASARIVIMVDAVKKMHIEGMLDIDVEFLQRSSGNKFLTRTMAIEVDTSLTCIDRLREIAEVMKINKSVAHDIFRWRTGSDFMPFICAPTRYHKKKTQNWKGNHNRPSGGKAKENESAG